MNALKAHVEAAVRFGATLRKELFDTARSEGMTAEQAGRWVAYLDRMAAKGEPPISLEEALAQIRLAKRSPREAIATVAGAGEPS